MQMLELWLDWGEYQVGRWKQVVVLASFFQASVEWKFQTTVKVMRQKRSKEHS